MSKTTLGLLYVLNPFFGFPDSVVEKSMQKTIVDFYEGINRHGKEKELKEILSYKTGLDQAVTLQEFIIWRGNKGYRNAVSDKRSLDLATTLRLTAHESDMMDTRDDDYSPHISRYKKLDQKTLDRNFEMFRIYRDSTEVLKNLVFKRFSELHPNVKPIYDNRRKEVEDGQIEDQQLHFWMLEGKWDYIRKKFPTEESAMSLLRRKLGIIGGGVSDISYEESGGSNKKLENVLFEFWVNCAIRMQYWNNDVKKLFDDVKNLDTNPIITTAFLRYNNADELNLDLIKKLLADDPTVLRKLDLPYKQNAEENLEYLKRHGFNYNDHKRIHSLIESVSRKREESVKNKI